VPEWIGKTPDAKVPRRVRLRIFMDHEGYCWISKRKIAAGEPWDLDHKVALCNGGEHRENNLAPALRDKHRKKTVADVAEKSAVYRKAAKHAGIRPPPQIQSRGFSPRPPQARATTPLTKQLPARRFT
jgi:5-methylcytosine-specific restriction endonuclease McrA